MDEQFLFLNDRWALAYDGNQWIVQRRAGTEWRAKSFVAGQKHVLQRVLDEKGVIPTPEAKRALRHLPDSFRDWYASFQFRGAAE